MNIPQRAIWLLLIASTVFPIAANYSIDGKIVMAQIFVESSYRPEVVNNGCYGLTQVNLKVWAKTLHLKKSNLLSVKGNLEAGLHILNIYYQQTGSIWAALYRYNAGYRYNGYKYVAKIINLLVVGK